MRATFQKKRGRILSKRQEIISSDLSQSKSSIREPEIALRVGGREGGIRQALQQAQVMLTEQREAREDLQKKVSRLQMRGIDREKEFRRIIQETIPFCVKESSAAVINADLRVVHENLVSFFAATQEAVEVNLEQHRIALQQQVQRRLQAVTDHAQAEIHAQKRLQSLNYEAIHREISSALTNCTAIITENQEMKRRIRELTFNNAMLKEERGLLIEEVLEKKNLILKMYGQLREKYSRDDGIEKEIAILKEERQKVDKKYAAMEVRLKEEGCFRTIDSIRPKAALIFTTDPNNPINTSNKPLRSHSKDSTPIRFSSTVDVKSRSTAKASLHRTIATCSSEKEQVVLAQLKERLRQERRKNIIQAQKIDYLVGYKREIDIFVRECYRSGGLDELDQEKVRQLLTGLKRVMQRDTFEECPTKTNASNVCTQQEYQEMLESF